MYEKELASSLAEVAARRGSKGFTFEDLLRGAQPQSVHIGAVAGWLSQVRSSALVEEMGFDPGAGSERLGPRRYRLATSGRRERQVA